MNAFLHTLIILGEIGGAVVFLGLLWKGVQALVRLKDDFIGAPGDPGVRDRLSAIEKELHPNGGSSLKDAVTRIEEKADRAVAVAAATAQVVAQNHAETRAEVAGLAGELRAVVERRTNPPPDLERPV